ncbi:toll-like receptor 5 [Amia ocellicauda]|uniref:toll-like receptor 5 n=1 Tax=Amia ocellicauda TaxID=2972642 RepID=UPI003464E14E
MWCHHIFVFLGLSLAIRWSSPCTISSQYVRCPFQSLTEVPDLPSDVRRADLSLNYIREVGEGSFPRLEQLTFLDLGSQFTKYLHIKENAFRNLTNLASLILSGNINLVLDLGTFVGLHKLKFLDLLYNGLTAAIFEDVYLQPLVSLEDINLSSNRIERMRPNLFFRNLTNLKQLRLKLNQIKTLCEDDLLGFQGKSFDFLDISSNHFYQMDPLHFDWKTCGNPFRNMSFQVLDLSLNSFSEQRAQLFFKAIEGTKIHHIILSSNTMGKSFGYSNVKDPNMQTFEGLKNSAVRILDLSKNFIFSLETSVFAHLKELEEIILAANKINQIQSKAFAGLQNLKMLNLSSNLIGEVYINTFEGLDSVTQLDLSDNHIGAVQHMAFHKLHNLQILNLKGNSLRSLHTLAPIPQMQFVLLSDNKLSSSYGFTNFATNSVFVDLSKNSLKNLNSFYEVMRLPHIQYILLRHNAIAVCNNELVIPRENNLIYLDLEDNMLQLVWEMETCLDMFDNLGKLIRLRLNQNMLQFLPKDIFKGLISLESMDLSSNFLSHLPENIFPQSLKNLNLSKNILGSPNPDRFHSLTQIDLGNNPYICDCFLKDFLLWMNQTNITFLSPLDDLECVFPNDLSGVRLIDYNTELCQEEDKSLILRLKFTLFVSCTTVLILMITSAITFTRFRGVCFVIYKKVITIVLGRPKKASSGETFKYDVYLCFSNNDFKWVETAVIKQLDSQFSKTNLFHTCFEARDFIPGEDHISNIRDAIWCSKKTVCIVTKEFLKDGWCIEAFNLAQSRLYTELKDVLIMVVVGRLPQFKLMRCSPIRTFVRSRHYMHWPEDFQDLGWFYEKLAKSILKEEKIKKQSDVVLQTISKQIGNWSSEHISTIDTVTPSCVAH